MDRADLGRALAMAALVALLLAGLAVLSRRSEAPAVRETAPAIVPLPDDLPAELGRCAGLGASQAGDARCMAVWEENRRRFFGRPARPIAPTAVPVTDSTSAAHSAGSEGAGR